MNREHRPLIVVVILGVLVGSLCGELIWWIISTDWTVFCECVDCYSLWMLILCGLPIFMLFVLVLLTDF